MIENAHVNKLPPMPNIIADRRGNLKAKNSKDGTEANAASEIKIVAKTVKLTYALKVTFNPDLCKFESKSLKSGRTRSVFSPISR
jgi:hypothetical protein